jgi:hypothetical protein
MAYWHGKAKWIDAPPASSVYGATRIRFMTEPCYGSSTPCSPRASPGFEHFVPAIDAAQSTQRSVEEREADLLVMGCYGHRGNRRIIGAFTRDPVWHTAAAVAVVLGAALPTPAKTRESSPGTLLRAAKSKPH